MSRRLGGRTWALALAAVVALWTGAGSPPAAASDDQQHHEGDSQPTGGKKPAAAEEEAEEPRGIFDKTLTFRAEGITLQFGGFAKVDFIQDFDPIGSDSQFRVNSIPVAGDPAAELGGSTNFQARQTRFSLDLRADASTDSTDHVRVYVEGDFFGSGNSFRLRHGYGEWRGLLGGQTWSTFQDISSRPFTLDYEGPDGEVFVRQAMIRYTGHPSEDLEWSVAAEDPNSQITVAAGAPSGAGRSEFPDLPFRLRFKPRGGHAEVAGILRQIRFVSDNGALKETATGWGISLSGKTTTVGGDAFMGHVGFGSGIGRYIESLGGTGSDAVLTPAGRLEPLDVWAGTVGFTHHWNSHYTSTIAVSATEVDNDPNQPGDAIRSARSAHANLVYSPNRLIVLGGELMWGERENSDRAKGDALRFQFSIQYKFR